MVRSSKNAVVEGEPLPKADDGHLEGFDASKPSGGMDVSATDNGTTAQPGDNPPPPKEEDPPKKEKDPLKVLAKIAKVLKKKEAEFLACYANSEGGADEIEAIFKVTTSFADKAQRVFHIFERSKAERSNSLKEMFVRTNNTPIGKDI